MEDLSLWHPESASGLLGSVLRGVLPAGPAAVQEAGTVPVLDPGTLRCLALTLHGTRLAVRTPFAFPFVSAELRSNFHGEERPLETVPGIDWLFLGGDPQALARAAARHVQANPGVRLTLRPFGRLAGTLPRERRPGDVPLCLRKTCVNYNQTDWFRLKPELLARPEEDWAALGANTQDTAALFAPHLKGLAGPVRLVVDLGCGLGQTTRTLARMFPKARVVGLDTSTDAMEVARQAFPLPNLEFCRFDFSDKLPFENRSVDLMVSCNALAYAENQLKTASDIFALLAPGGRLLNHCRLYESHLYWDFPASLLLPTDEQLQVCNWAPMAAKFGFSTEVLPSALGFGGAYFRAYAREEFREAFDAVMPGLAAAPAFASPPASTWSPHFFQTHGLIIHRPCLAAGAGENPSQPVSHTARLAEVISALGQAPEASRPVTALGWMLNHADLGLLPQAVDFMAAVLPEAAGVVARIFSPEFLERTAPLVARTRTGPGAESPAEPQRPLS